MRSIDKSVGPPSEAKRNGQHRHGLSEPNVVAGEPMRGNGAPIGKLRLSTSKLKAASEMNREALPNEVRYMLNYDRVKRGGAPVQSKTSSMRRARKEVFRRNNEK